MSNLSKYKPLLNKQVKAIYLDWDDVRTYEGILERINKCSVVVSGRIIKAKGLSIEFEGKEW